MKKELAINVQSFDSFTDLALYLQGLRQKYRDQLKEYENKLGNILRDFDAAKIGDPKERQAQKEWIHHMKSSIKSSGKEGGGGGGSTQSKKIPPQQHRPPPAVAAARKEKNNSGGGGGGKFGFGKNSSNGGKQQKDEDWIQLGPSMIFLGKNNKGLAELYFDSINLLRANVEKINAMVSICEKLKAKTSGMGSGSLIVYFVQDVPQKIMVQMNSGQSSEKYSLSYSVTIPASEKMTRSILLQ